MSNATSPVGQMLSLISRTKFAELAREWESDRNSKGFTTWGQFVAMIFCQTAKAGSLLDICQGLRSCLGRLSHLALERGPYEVHTFLR